jgi:hypothetical protein
MSYTLSAFSVDFDSMTTVLRKGDTTLFEKLKKDHADDLESYQEYLDDAFDEDDDDNDEGGGVMGAILSIFGKKKGVPEPVENPSVTAITTEEALRHLTVGGNYVSYGGTAYGYMYEWLCEEFGERLRNDQWSSLRSGSRWIEIVDSALSKSGVSHSDFSIEGTLMSRGAPLGFPFGDDFPSLGYLTASECVQMNEKFSNLDLEAVSKKTPHPVEAEEGLREMHQWFKVCAESNRGLACLYY